MQNEKWEQVKELLDQVLQLDSAKREDFLNSSNADLEVADEVRSLISFESEAEGLMDLSAIEFSKDFFSIEEDSGSLIGQQIGIYRIIKEIGFGGMGAVYLGERTDGKFDQKVAIKMLKREMNTRTIRRHFEREQKILSSLEHSNIARLLDAGTMNDKTPYLVMEYVDGLPIDVYCSKNNLNISQRLDLFRKVCNAVNFAHRNLVIHRDLKPSNILVSSDNEPKLLDFGISKILSEELDQINAATITRIGAMTPSYASPEQLQQKSVTTATDVYSLGIILYELLSGHRPFEEKEENLKDIYEAVVNTDPPLPSAKLDKASKELKTEAEKNTELLSETPSNPETESTLSEFKDNQTIPQRNNHTNPQLNNLNANNLRGDLDNIILKSLRKEPERRYSSAENFSEDIKNFLRGLPVTARPNTFSYRTSKFVKRNKLTVIAAGLISLAVIVGVIATLWQARIAQAERTKAENRFNDVRSLANSFLFEFSPLIENLPGSTPARELLVKRALEYLDNLSKEAENDFELQKELGIAYEKVGDVQGNPANSNLGDMKGAIASYEKVVGIREKLFANDANDLNTQSSLADIYKRLASVLNYSNEPKKSDEFLDKALAIQEKIIAAQPNDFESQKKYSELLRSKGLNHFFTNENKEAIGYYNRAKEISEKLYNEQPNNPRISEQYFYIFVAIGEAQGWEDDPQNAAINLQKGLDLLIGLSEKYPADYAIHRSLMLAYQKRAEIHEDVKEYSKSIELYEKGLLVSQKEILLDPRSFQAKRDVAMAYKKLAQVLDASGKGYESIKNLDLAIENFQQLREIDPNNPETFYDIANTQYSIGQAYISMKKFELALNYLGKARDGFQTVLEKNPNNMYAHRMSSYNFTRLGRAFAGLSLQQNPKENLQKSIDNYQIGLKNLYKMRDEKNLSEWDNEEISQLESETKNVKEKMNNFKN